MRDPPPERDVHLENIRRAHFALMSVLDLNADLGEGFGAWRLTDDAALLDVVTSANVACGFHAGDPVTMRRVAELAAERGVAVGAHVGYRDLAGFGRRPMAVAAEDLAGDVLYQLGALDACCRGAGIRVRYVKAHGALYNTAVLDGEVAAGLCAGVAAFGEPLPVLGLPGSEILRAAEAAGLPGVPEGFPDRGYSADGTLVSRSRPGALLDDADAIAARAVGFSRGEVDTVEGGRVQLDVRSVCLHGDGPVAVAAAKAVRAALEAEGVKLEPFA